MKNIIICITLLLAFVKLNAQNGELSTLRIGALKYGMSLKEIKEISEKPLKNGKDRYESDCKIATYKGEEIKFIIYSGDTNEDETKIYDLSTNSPKFRTKSGLGVGSTKEQLLEAYKNYPNFSVGQTWDDKTHKQSTTETFFDLEDVEAGTHLNFMMKNNVVIEVRIFMEEGC